MLATKNKGLKSSAKVVSNRRCLWFTNGTTWAFNRDYEKRLETYIQHTAFSSNKPWFGKTVAVTQRTRLQGLRKVQSLQFSRDVPRRLYCSRTAGHINIVNQQRRKVTKYKYFDHVLVICTWHKNFSLDSINMWINICLICSLHWRKTWCSSI